MSWLTGRYSYHDVATEHRLFSEDRPSRESTGGVHHPNCEHGACMKECPVLIASRATPNESEEPK